jgi:hypothetical protein
MDNPVSTVQTHRCVLSSLNGQHVSGLISQQTRSFNSLPLLAAGQVRGAIDALWETMLWKLSYTKARLIDVNMLSRDL